MALFRGSFMVGHNSLDSFPSLCTSLINSLFQVCSFMDVAEMYDRDNSHGFLKVRFATGTLSLLLLLDNASHMATCAMNSFSPFPGFSHHASVFCLYSFSPSNSYKWNHKGVVFCVCLITVKHNDLEIDSYC